MTAFIAREVAPIRKRYAAELDTKAAELRV